MINDTISAVPPFLEGTLATMAFARRAGEWELELAPEGDANLKMAELVRQFEEAFPWASHDILNSFHADGTRSWNSSFGISAPQWLEQQAAEAYGFESKISLRLAWRSEEGKEGESWFKGSGRLQFDRQSMLSTLTIWPNLFTNEVPIYEHGEDGYGARLINWEHVAEFNRRRLESSLRNWETRSGARIISWESELIEGIGRYGIPEGAKARY